MEMHHGSVLLTFIFAVVGNVVNDLTRDDVLSELMNADDLVLMSKKMTDLGITSENGKRLLRARVLKIAWED